MSDNMTDSQATHNGEDIMYGQYVVPPANKMVKFNVGQPSPAMLDLDILREGLAYTGGITNPSLLQYGDIPGYKKFRDSLSGYLTKMYRKCRHQWSRYPMSVQPTELFVNNGITDGLRTICSLFIPGSKVKVYVEEPTYFLALNIFKNDFKLETDVVPIGVDGIDVDVLEQKLSESDDGETLRILYTIPTFHNPTSYTQSHGKRVKLADLARKSKNFMIVADEVYQLLYFDQEPPPPLCYYTHKAISLGSFSKILGPAYRLGWIQTLNPNYLSVFADSGIFDSSGGTSPLVQSIIHGIILSGGLERSVENCRKYLSNGCDSLYGLVTEKLSEYVEVIKPTGGYFLWLKLKRYSAGEIASFAAEHGVQFIPGVKFSARDGCDDYIRLSFSYYDSDGFKIGVDRLLELFRKMDFMKKTKVFIMGHKGRLGSLIVDLLKDNSTMRHYNYYESALSPSKMDPDVAIDISSPAGTKEMINILTTVCRSYPPLVIGTTGDLPMKEIEEYSKKAPVAIISNFSRGIPQLIELINHIDTDEWDISIDETHHVHKKDAPSGTAITLAEAFNDAVPITSHREGEVIGDHSIIMTTPTERITIRHEALKREIFASGALRFAEWIRNRSPGIYYSMKDKVVIPTVEVKTEVDSTKFSKYSACGNDFIILEWNHVADDLDEDNISDACSRGTGIGADGLILVDHSLNVSQRGDETVHELGWRYYNSDGNVAEMCGNGARCVVQYALDKNIITRDMNVSLINLPDDSDLGCETRVEFMKGETKKKYGDFRIDMTSLVGSPSDLNPFIVNGESVEPKYIEVGVPHVVCNVTRDTFNGSINTVVEQFKTTNDCKFSADGKIRVNLNINYTDKYGHTHIRTFERGVNGETLACGTGCCAVSLVHREEYNQRGMSKFSRIITKSGGQVLVFHIVENGRERMKMSGHADLVYSGVI